MLGLIGSSANIPSIALFVELKRTSSEIVTAPPDVFVNVFDIETVDVPPLGAAVAFTVYATALANPVEEVSVVSAVSVLISPFTPVPKLLH